MTDMKQRLEDELGPQDPSEVVSLNLDNCRSGGTVEGLTDEFTSLKTLSLIGIELRMLTSFPKLPSLTKLELADNRIAGGLDQLLGCPALTSLNLMNNKIKSLATLEPLKSLEHLKDIALESNPIASDEDYEHQVFELLPQLSWVDDTDKNGNKRSSDDEDEEDEEEDEDEYEDEEGDDDDDGDGDGDGDDNQDEDEDEADDDNDNDDDDDDNDEADDNEEGEDDDDDDDQNEGPAQKRAKTDDGDDDDEEEEDDDDE